MLLVSEQKGIYTVGFLIDNLSTSFFIYRQFTPGNTIITYHNALFLSPKNFVQALFSVSLAEKLKTMLMQNFGVANKERYGMLWYFLEWSIINERVSVMVCHLNFCRTLVFSLPADWSTFLRSFRDNALKFTQCFINEKLEPVP